MFYYQTGEDIMANFTDYIPGLTFVVVMFSLFMSLVGIIIVRKTSKNQINNSEPWSLTKLKGDLWLLKRNTPVIATIHGITVEHPENLEDLEVLKNLESTNTVKKPNTGFSFLSSPDEPSKQFKAGTTILIRLDSVREGTTFTLYYEEYKRASSTSKTGGYHPDLTREEITTLPSKVQEWSVALY